MEERDLIPEIDPTLGLTDEQVQSRTPAGKPVYSGKSEKEIVLTHCFTFFNLIFVILAVMLIIGGSSPLNMGFLVVAVINTVIGIIQEIRAKRAVERLTLVAERPVAVIRNGTRQEISPEAIVKDDIAEFASGDTLPADGILRSGEMWVDESLLTGEADAVTKTPGDEVKSGSAILSGRGRVQFTAVGGDSFAAQLSREAQKKPGAKKSEMMRSLDRLILFVGIALVPVGIILFYQEFCVLKLGLESSVEGTVAALVGMIPEGLYLLTSIAMAASAVKLSRKKVLVQDMNCIETLARVDVLCVDKTGTITEPDMEVENVVPLSGGSPEYLEAVLTAMYGASEPDNATGKAIHELFDGETDWVCEKRIPFSPETKWSGAVFAGQGAFLVGAPEFILAQRYEEYRDTVDGWAEQGCRVLLAARYDGDPVPGGLDPALVAPLALILLSGRIREQAAETFGYFDRQGVTVKVISGDNPHTASLIAARAGIPGADRCIDTSALETDEDFSRAAGVGTKRLDLLMALLFGFDLRDAVSVAVIGAADGPTSIFVAQQLGSGYTAAIMVAAYSYMALVPMVQPPVIRLCTTQAERKIKMTYKGRPVSKTTKILFPIAVTVIVGLVAPQAVALIGFLMFGNLIRECGVLNSLSETAQNVLANLITILLGLTIASRMNAAEFLRVETLLILGLGLVAFVMDTVGGVMIAKLMNLFLKEKINPMIGAAGISAFPMSARVVHKMGLAEDKQNFLLMHAAGVNVSGQIASVIAGGLILALVGG